jgi:transposase-like protein
MSKFTKRDFEAMYPDDASCLHKIFTVRFGHLKECPECKKSFDYKRLSYKSKVKGAQKKAYQCSHCGNQIYPLAGSIFEKSTTSLKDWFYALYLFTAIRNGVAVKELERQLGVCYKSALRMAHQLKKLMANKTQPVLSGVVEVDETFLGELEKNKHAHKRTKENGYVGKTYVFGMMQQGGNIIAEIVEKVDWKTLRPIILEKVEEKSTIITDGFLAYKDLPLYNFKHEIINHMTQEYVRGGFHTNTLEGFWSQLKRMLKGTHIHVSKKHLQKYIDECATRYMLRNEPGEMFDIIEAGGVMA